MAGGGFLSSIITMAVDKLHSLALPSTPSSSSSPHNNIEQEMSKLTETMRRVQAKLADSEEDNHVKSHSEKLWLSELKEVAYDAEDLVEEYEYEVLRSKQLHGNNSGTHEGELANKAAEIRKRFDEITKEWKLLTLPKNAGERKRSPLTLVDNRETGSLVLESDVLGREEEKDMLVEWLLSEDDMTDNRVSVIAIIGMGGLGKTTLAQLVYNDPKVKSYFNPRGWVCVSENFNVVNLTEKILQSFTEEKGKGEVKIPETLDGLQRALEENLLGKKFLLILDDVWNEEFTLWYELRKPLVSAQVGKVIVTTRNQPVARIMGIRSPLDLNCLPFDVCWQLFKRVTLGGADQPHLEDLGRKIVDKCKGLPLAVKVLGGALRNKEDIDSWEDILENKKWELEETNKGVLPALKISYDCMPIQLKRCFQYLSLFPKHTRLHSEIIVRLWMSQGLLPLDEDDRDKRAEDKGRNYIERLAERSMIQLKWSDSFLMHNLVHDLAQYIAQDECFCMMDNKFDTKKLQKIRHLSVSIEDPHLLKHLETITDQQLKLMRTLFIRVQDKSRGRPFITRQDKNFGVLDDLFQNLKYIRALHLSQIGIRELPDTLGNLKLLNYLSIKDIAIKSIPESIHNLYNLQTLDLTQTNISELPRQIDNLINLRHLLLSHKVAFLPSGIGNLTNLQTLTHFNVGCGKKHCDIGELNSLMKLGGHISIYNVALLHRSIATMPVNKFSNTKPTLKTKKYLDSLRLDWLREHDNFDRFKQDEKKAEQQLAYLQPHVNLKFLEINNYPGVRFVEWVSDSSFTKLTRLILEDCKNCTKLPPLGQLRYLEYLDIRGMDGVQHVGREFCSMLMASPSSSQNNMAFPSLTHLEFSSMPNWKGWDGVEIGDFPSLHFIEISKCSKLIKFPQWPFMSSVKEMTLGNCGALDVLNLHLWTNLSIGIKTQEHSKWMSKCYFPTLQHLTLKSRVECVHLSQKRLPSLKTLEIQSSEELRVIGGLEGLTSLTSLIIRNCFNLEFEKLPATLQQLRLSNCPLFHKGLEKQPHMLNVLRGREEGERRAYRV
ncbi:putative disease resistance RPP13-like protein 1 isoform X2 [Zingiber officinale]|uniref:putative disease resistance RPP13-like protein 1 isoform X2 n=1 Tax=Zingiber officinale TaxID=94328 RepID=UPI001C4BC716|nr:putative disease resistance RPP13-like protein 1 isoform X2 [Zingiber officinale]